MEPHRDPGTIAVGTWSGGRFMRFGEPIDDRRFVSLITPDDSIDTVITADVYGTGEADRMLGRALAGRPRGQACVIGAVGHDFYAGERDGPKGFPRFTDTHLRGPSEYGGYLRMATERSLERCGIDSFDLLLLHNPDRTGYTSEVVWNGMAALRDAGLTRLIGVAPGPANGFTLDLIDCFERFGALIDWAMIILNPLEPWPGELCLSAAAASSVKVITRVVDYGGLFFDDVLAGQEMLPHDHRSFRPAGWIESGRDRLERMRPIADRAGLTLIQLACQRNLAHDPGDRSGRPFDREQAPGARRPPPRDPPHGRRRRRDPRDRRQRRLHGVEGREPRARRRRARRQLVALPAPRGCGSPLEDRAPAGSRARVIGRCRWAID
jgi:aryl-alcohol dehydrogenase-like predicted oxidoreductase